MLKSATPVFIKESKAECSDYSKVLTVIENQEEKNHFGKSQWMSGNIIKSQKIIETLVTTSPWYFIT